MYMKFDLDTRQWSGALRLWSDSSGMGTICPSARK